MAKILAVCISEKKGTTKQDIKEGHFRQEYGLEGDAHADSGTHRQVSLLAIEGINRVRALGYKVNPGDFAENLTTEGIDLPTLPIGTRLHVGKEVVLEITQIGKECHTGCAVFRLIGKCIMPFEGTFARVINGGTIKAGDEIIQDGK